MQLGAIELGGQDGERGLDGQGGVTSPTTCRWWFCKPAQATLPDGAAALPAVESASRRTLEEMRRMIDVLRLADTGVEATRAPQPSLRDLPALVAHARAAGHIVELKHAGGIDLSAYRVVQEDGPRSGLED